MARRAAGGTHTARVTPPTAEQLSLGFADRSLPIGSHACYYYGDEATLRGSMEFLRVGLDEPGTFCVIFADASRFDTLVAWLGDGYEGDVAGAVEAGKVALIPGAASLDALVALVTQRLDAAIRDGYERIRFLGFIGWGRPGWPDDRDLLEFESRVNQVVTKYPAVVLCTYGVPALSGDALIRGGLQTHPIAVIGDTVVTNSPFYVAPDDFIGALDQLHANRD